MTVENHIQPCIHCTYRIPPCADISISQECCVRDEDWVVLRVVHSGSTGATKPDPADSFAVSLWLQEYSYDVTYCVM